MSNQLSSTTLTSSQTVYVMMATSTGCFDITNFQVEITNNCNTVSGTTITLGGTLHPSITYNYRSCGDIISTTMIPNGTDVDYRANNFIKLMPGFTAMAGSDFLAKIVNCSNLNEDAKAVSRQAPLEESTVLTSPATKVYPNPSRYVTNIELTLSAETQVQLDLYDMSGRKIVNLVSNATLPRGVHEFQWQAEQFEAGMYFLALNGQVIEKVVVIH